MTLKQFFNKYNTIKYQFKQIQFLNQFVKLISKKFNKSFKQAHLDVVFYLRFGYNYHPIVELYNQYVKLIKENNKEDIQKLFDNVTFNYQKQTNYIPGKMEQW